MLSSYYAIRPVGRTDVTRIQKADTPQKAAMLAFGRGTAGNNWEYKDLGKRINVIQSDSKRIALLTSPDGWIKFPPLPYQRSDDGTKA